MDTQTNIKHEDRIRFIFVFSTYVRKVTTKTNQITRQETGHLYSKELPQRLLFVFRSLSHFLQRNYKQGLWESKAYVT